jgi:hypothetical protein
MAITIRMTAEAADHHSALDSVYEVKANQDRRFPVRKRYSDHQQTRSRSLKKDRRLTRFKRKPANQDG